MKRNKIIIPLLFVGIFSFFSNALLAQLEVGARAGLNLSNMVVKDKNGDLRSGSTALPGFHAGLTFDIPVMREFAIQPGVLFSTKGAQIKGDTYEYIFDEDYYSGDYTNYNAYYVEVPVNFIYKPIVGNGRLLLGAGPYVALGLGGTWKDKYDGKITTGKLEFINDWNDRTQNRDPYGRKIDAGLNLLGGYEFANRLSLQLNAQLGAANLEPYDNGVKPAASLRNTMVGVSVGYKF